MFSRVYGRNRAGEPVVCGILEDSQIDEILDKFGHSSEDGGTYKREGVDGEEIYWRGNIGFGKHLLSIDEAAKLAATLRPHHPLWAAE